MPSQGSHIKAAVVNSPLCSQVTIPDIEVQGSKEMHCFTDGAGEISRSLLQDVLGSMGNQLRPFEVEGDVSALQVTPLPPVLTDKSFCLSSAGSISVR